MKKCKKEFLKSIVGRITVLILVFGMGITSSGNVFLTKGACNTAKAKTKTVNETGWGQQSGRYVYYAFEMDGVRMGIMRYDVKTKQKKEIFSYRYKGEETNGFYYISVKGNYIYAVWDQYFGTGASQYYIYRIAKDGSSSKRLAGGIEPVIIGNRIYYEKCKLVYDGYMNVSESTGQWYSMTLDGTDKRKVSKPSLKRVFGNSYEAKKTDVIGNYRYYISGHSLYKESVISGQKKKLISCKNGIIGFYVTGGYILVKGTVKGTTSYSQYDLAVFIIDTEGNNKKKLASWIPAE